MVRVNGGYESDGVVYRYAIWDRTRLCLLGRDTPWVYAMTLQEAFATVYEMIRDYNMEQLEIGTPSGGNIEIDARHFLMSDIEGDGV